MKAVRATSHLAIVDRDRCRESVDGPTQDGKSAVYATGRAVDAQWKRHGGFQVARAVAVACFFEPLPGISIRMAIPQGVDELSRFDADPPERDERLDVALSPFSEIAVSVVAGAATETVRQTDLSGTWYRDVLSLQVIDKVPWHPIRGPGHRGTEEIELPMGDGVEHSSAVEPDLDHITRPTS